MTNQRFTVTYPGLFGEVSRSFTSQARAIQWVSQAGVERKATIVPAAPDTCLTCGMVATADPFEHSDRYGHAPVVRFPEGDFRFDPSTGGFTISEQEGS